jgi:PAS domain S-box-containing protein
MRTGVVKNLEIDYFGPNRLITPIEINAKLVQNGKGKRVLSLCRDITERKRAEESLALSQRQLAAAMDLARLANWEYDVASNLYTFDDRFFALYGTTVEREGGSQMTPETYAREFCFPEDAHLVMEGIKKHLTATDPDLEIQIDHRIRRRDGEVRHLLIRAASVSDANGRITKIRGVNQDITERKRAELQLADALELNRTMIAASPVSMAAFKTDGQCVFANAALARAANGTVEQLMAQNFWKLDSWRESGMIEMAKEALSQGHARTREVTMTTSFGREFCAETSMTRFISGGEPHLLVMTHDITERKRAEESLALSQRQLAAAMDMARLANWEYDVASDLYTFDDRFFALYGSTAEREGGNQMSPETYAREFFYPEDAHMLREWIKTVLATTDSNSQAQFEHRIRRRDGEMRHLAVRIGFVKDASGRIIRFRGVNQDITERKHAELQLADALELNRTMIAAAPVGIAAYKASGQCIFANEAISRITGGSIEQLLRQNFRDFPSWRRNGILNWAEEALRQGYYSSAEMHGTTTFGRDVWCQFFFARFVSGGENHLLLIVHDVSSRKRLEQQILEITDREQARIGQDLHDGLCQQLVSLAFDANALQRRLSAHNSPEAVAGGRIADFLDQAITESRRVSRGLFPIRLQAEGLASALEELARTTSERFGVQCSFQNPQPVLVKDLPIATHLYRIAQEAVSNAIKHGRPRVISIRLEENAPNFDLKVEDDGIGLSPGTPDHSGMGLHIMRYRAASIGATFGVESRPSGGVTVSCCFRSPSS